MLSICYFNFAYRPTQYTYLSKVTKVHETNCRLHGSVMRLMSHWPETRQRPTNVKIMTCYKLVDKLSRIVRSSSGQAGLLCAPRTRGVSIFLVAHRTGLALSPRMYRKQVNKSPDISRRVRPVFMYRA